MHFMIKTRVWVMIKIISCKIGAVKNFWWYKTDKFVFFFSIHTSFFFIAKVSLVQIFQKFITSSLIIEPGSILAKYLKSKLINENKIGYINIGRVIEPLQSIQ